MAFGRELKRRGKAVIAPAIFLAITAYFGWSVTQGAHGLIAYSQRENLLLEAQAGHDAAQAERDTWQQRVAGLQANHLDLDTLDERARAMLNLADPNDIIVPYGPKDRVF
jgi:cell division protein FtsB